MTTPLSTYRELADLVKGWADEIERLLPPATPTYNVVHEMRLFCNVIKLQTNSQYGKMTADVDRPEDN